MQLFVHATLVLEEGLIADGYLLENQGVVVSFGSMPPPMQHHSPSMKVFDCTGLYLSPGFVDIHTHGSGGHDYMDGTVEAFIGAAKAHMRNGATTILPTTLACTDEHLFQTLACFKEATKSGHALPHLPGLHLEGPYLNPQEKGAMEPAHLRIPTEEHYMHIVEKAESSILRWSLAPELPGALAMADRVIKEGIRVSAAHTCATYEQMSEAFDHGINHLTHFYSAMSTITRKNGFRVLGVVESGYLIDGLTLEIIADGMHLPPPLLRLIYQCKNADQICACTDSMRSSGEDVSTSILGPKEGGTTVLIEDGIAKMPDRTCFAGSIATCDRLVRVLMQEVKLDLVQAIRAVSYLPAKFMGLETETGSIAVGKRADLVLFDKDIQIKRVFVSGKEMVHHDKSMGGIHA